LLGVDAAFTNGPGTSYRISLSCCSGLETGGRSFISLAFVKRKEEYQYLGIIPSEQLHQMSFEHQTLSSKFSRTKQELKVL